MPVTITKYATFTTSAIIARCSLQKSVMTASGDNVECEHFQVTDVKGAVGIATSSIGAMCSSNKVNIYSGFGPTELYINGGSLASRVKTPYALGNFAGYNHSALIPGWYSNSCSNDVWVISGGTATFIADIITGEINYAALDNVLGIAFTLWEGANLIDYSLTDVATLGDISNLDLEIENVTQEKTYTGKIYLVDNLSTFGSNLGNVMATIPNVNNFTVHTKVYVGTTLNTSGCSGWTLDTPGINLSLATVSFNDLYCGNSIGEITVQVRLVKQIDNSVETTEFYKGAYTANTHLGAMSEQIHASTPIPAYGYTAFLEVLESV